MAKPAFISTITNNTIYISTYPIEATVQDVEDFYDELEQTINKLKGAFVVIFNLSNSKWLDLLPRLKMAERSQALYTKHSANYLAKILISNSAYINISIGLFNLINTKTAPQYTIRTLGAAKKTAENLFNKHKYTIELN